MEPAQPAPALEGGIFGASPTITAGQLADYLAQFDRDTPVTVATEADHWYNIDGATDPRTLDEPSVILVVRDDFSTRQW